MRRKIVLMLGLAATVAAGAAIAAIGPTGPGQFYYYFDDAGQVVGYSAIRCDGSRESWGKGTHNYSDGYFLCEPEI
ncbi:DUF6289 family protein [Marilutibacter maris]|uniref:Secreted protein n=1 Tax=Marilutibacter maris TaxID=1605891 RepID=A0A2U9TBL8_9GAMM|nr:DUF6289 family protein [Lysobacter maris]AWV07958.1 hypothetical protein C9I47_2275 [Lysobacter maris]